jgi:hypothetical protein
MGKPPGTKNTKTRERLRCASETLRSDSLRTLSDAVNGEARPQHEGNDAMISPTITSDCLTSHFGNLMEVGTPGGPADLGFDLPGELEHLDQSLEDVPCSESTTAVPDDLSSVSPSRSLESPHLELTTVVAQYAFTSTSFAHPDFIIPGKINLAVI